MSKDTTGNSFLNQFDSKNYSDNKKNAATAAANEPIKTIPRAAPARPGGSNSKIKAPDHVVVADQGYHKRKIVKMSIIGASVLVVAVLAFFGIRMVNSVEVMDFTGQNFSAATQWALQNGVSVQQNESYNLKFDPGIVFEQNVEAGSTIQRGSVVVLGVSQGADPNEVIPLPDFSAMTTGQVNTWRREMRMGNSVQVREETHDTVEAGRFIDLEHPPAVDVDHFTRSNSLTVVMSSGPRMLTMPNFVGRDIEEVEAWEEQQNIQVTIVTRFDEEKEAGEVLEQNIEARARFPHTEEVIITVAADEPVIVPDFSRISQEDAVEYEGLDIVRRDRFSTTVPFGRLIQQSITAGTELADEDRTITLVYSLGRPFMENLIGRMENVLASTFFEFNEGGANITYAVRYVDSYEPRGQIVNMSRFSEFIGMNDHITIDVSRGNLTPPEPPAEPVQPPQQAVPDAPPAPPQEEAAPEPDLDAGAGEVSEAEGYGDYEVSGS